MKECGISIDIITSGSASSEMKGIQATDIVQMFEEQGKTVYVAFNNVVAGIIAIADTVKPEARRTVLALQAMGVDVWMVTGDNRRTANTVAGQIGIDSDHVLSEVLPSEKVEKVVQLQLQSRDDDANTQAVVPADKTKKNEAEESMVKIDVALNANEREPGNTRRHVVAMVGDGINDSPALAQADLGIAIGAGTEIAIEAADMVLMNSHLADVLMALDLSRKTLRRIRINFVWALGYNCLGIPVACGIFFPFLKTMLPPEIAAAAMALSSVSVISSALLLKRYKRPAVATRSGELDGNAEIGEKGVEESMLEKKKKLQRALDAVRVTKAAPSGSLGENLTLSCWKCLPQWLRVCLGGSLIEEGMNYQFENQLMKMKVRQFGLGIVEGMDQDCSSRFGFDCSCNPATCKCSDKCKR
jgi:Cu+-exporting ATPase